MHDISNFHQQIKITKKQRHSIAKQHDEANAQCKKATTNNKILHLK